MIRPIQRLPSILLLLERLLKYTSRTHIDYQLLIDSLDKLREIAKKLNDERGKTEKHLSMFNIVNSIDNCPVRSSMHSLSLLFFTTTPRSISSRNYSLLIAIIWTSSK